MPSVTAGACARCGAEAELRPVEFGGGSAMLCPECAPIVAAVQEKSPLKGAVAGFIAQLENPDPNLRGHAAVMLERLTGCKFQFRTDAPEELRRRQAASWKEWFRGSGDAFFAEMDSRVLGALSDSRRPRPSPARFLTTAFLAQVVLLLTVLLSIGGIFVCAELLDRYPDIFPFPNKILGWALLLCVYETLAYGPLALAMRLRERRYLGAFRAYLEARQEQRPPS